jgi:hypothetical protein
VNIELEIFKTENDVVWLDGKALKISAKGFQVLYIGDQNYSVWLKNDEGYYFLDSYLESHTLKKLKCGALTILSEEYAKDELTVYWGAKPIPNSDPRSFRIVDNEIPNVHYFSYDRNQLYALGTAREGLQIWDDVDTASLVFFPDKEFFADKNHFYCYNAHFIEYINHFQSYVKSYRKKLKLMHPEADAWWNWSDSYYRDLNHVGYAYYGDRDRVFYYFSQEDDICFDYPFYCNKLYETPYYCVIANADADTFKPLNNYYAKDKNKIYHFARPISADVRSFRIIENNFAVDDKGIWYNGYFCSEAERDHFEVIQCHTEGPCFAKDRQHVYSAISDAKIGKFKGYSSLLRAQKNSDPKSFKIINNIWAKDANNVYCRGRIWKGIDAATFEYLFTDSDFTPRSYAKCKNGLYDANGRRKIKGVDGSSFVMLNQCWGKDRNVVFNFKSERVYKSIDAASFDILKDSAKAYDKRYEYDFDEFGYLIKRKLTAR